MSAYDRERAVARLDRSQSVTTAATTMVVSKSAISRFKKPLNMEMLYESMLMVVEGAQHLKRIDMNPWWRKGREISLLVG